MADGSDSTRPGTSSVSHGGAPTGWLDFSVNLNPCGPPPAVRDAIARARYDAYAHLDARDAERELAAGAGVPASHVMLTAGATEALRMAAAAFLAAGDRALVVGPTYGEYARAATLASATLEEVRAAPPLFAPPVSELVSLVASAPPRAIFMCDPNNPTGRALRPGELGAVLDALPERTLLVLDQSFAPFASPSLPASELISRRDVILVRSLTKSLAIPGVRVGHVVARPELLDAMRLVRDPWAVGAHACAVARVAAWELPSAAIEAVRTWRTQLAEALLRLGLSPLPSDANFLLVRVGPQAADLVAALGYRRIAVRGCTDFGLSEHIRVAVRPPPEQRLLLAALADVREELRW